MTTATNGGAGHIDFSGLIPATVAAEIISIAQANSAVLTLARRVPMPSGVTEMPVQTGMPSAAWLTSPGARKPFTDLTVGMVSMTAEEIAAIVAIPQVYIDDVSINLWNFVRPQLGSAIALALDNAVLFGTDAPATFPTDGLTGTDYCTTVGAGADALATVNDAMSEVEAQGLPVTGASADLAVKGALRGIRDANGALLFGPAQGQTGADVTPFGTPITYGQYPLGSSVNFITGDWDALILGVRQDIRYDLDSSGVIADGDGKVIISAFQDDVVLMRAYARYGCLVANPPTQRHPEGATPFASANIVPPVPPPGE